MRRLREKMINYYLGEYSFADASWIVEIGTICEIDEFVTIVHVTGDMDVFMLVGNEIKYVA